MKGHPNEPAQDYNPEPTAEEAEYMTTASVADEVDESPEPYPESAENVSFDNEKILVGKIRELQQRNSILEYTTSQVKKELLEVITRCEGEITGLRAHIETLLPMVKAFNVIYSVTQEFSPNRSNGLGEDLGWRLKKRMRELQDEISPSNRR